MRRMRCSGLLLVAMAAALIQTSVVAERRVGPKGGPKAEGAAEGLCFRLSEAEGSDATIEKVARPRAERLTDEETRRLLDRLPAVPAEPADEKPFALREGSREPPRTGRIVAAVFPPEGDTTRPEAASGPLTVVRRSPEGAVPLAPHLSVTFSLPMVEVTSQDDTAVVRPVKLVPEPEGQWRWLGTRTVVFEPKGRFPMATTYRVSVPKGTKATSGATLAEAIEWTFTTPPPQLLAVWPKGGPARRDTLVALAFDQRIDAEAIFESVRLGVPREKPQVRLATPEEIAGRPEVRVFVERVGKDRALVVRPVQPLPPDTAVAVLLNTGAPSAEGSGRTTATQRESFRTYGDLEVVKHECGWGGNCPPGTPFRAEFNNPLDENAFEESMVSVEPALPGLRASIAGNTLFLSGSSKGRTTYRVTLGSAIRDEFGQSLGKPAVLSFDVGQAVPVLYAPGGPLVILDPFAGPRFSIFTVNEPRVKVTLHAVTPNDWPNYLAWQRGERSEGNVARLPGRQVVARTLAIDAPPDEIAETPIDLTPALVSGRGHAILQVEETIFRKNQWERRMVRVWIQATQIGLDAFVDRERLTGFATDLRTGRPVEGVTLSLIGGERSARTGSDGLATLPLLADPAVALVATRGEDTALVPETAYPWGGPGWTRHAAGEELRYSIFDDRGMYKPGEEASLKGFVRLVGQGPTGGVEWVPNAVTSVGWILRDSRRNEIGKGETLVGSAGGFHLAVKIPNDANLGQAWLQLDAKGPRAAGGTYSHSFEIQEFRRPEFEVTASAEAGPHIVGGSTAVSARAAYYAGGALADTEIAWHVTARPARFAPPNRGDFCFGHWRPFWDSVAGIGNATEHTLTSRTDSLGTHRLRIDFDSVRPIEPTSVVAEAQVEDVNRQAWTGSVTLLVHPSDVYVGLRSRRPFVGKGEEAVVESIVTDLDGAAVVGRSVEVSAKRVEWRRRRGEWQEEVAEQKDCTSTSGAGPSRCSFGALVGGQWRIVARVEDDRRRPNESEIRLWVAGGAAPPSRGIAQQKVELVPDRKEYAAGETAEVLVLAPFAPAEGILTLDRDGTVRQERFRMEGGSHTLRIPVDGAWTPNVHARVSLVGAVPRTDALGREDAKLPSQPAFASGEIDLSIPPKDRALVLGVKPRESELAPGGATTIEIDVKDAGGRAAAGAEIAVAVVDEAVLALSGHRWEDPLGVFHARRGEFVRRYDGRAYVSLAKPEDGARGEVQALGRPVAARSKMAMALAGARQGRMETMDSVAMMAADMAMPAPAPAGAAPQSASTPIAVRSDFRATALFLPLVVTGADGHARAEVRLPESLTRYRIMAVAAAGVRQFGAGEATLTSRLPIMVRPSPPRFLNFGDQFELPVVVQNQTAEALRVEVAVRATNASLTDGAGRRVTVPPHDRVEVRFPSAAQKAGRARFQIAAAAGAFADAADADLPVWTPTTTEAFATYGEIDSGAVVQPVRAPSDSVADFGGLELSTSSTAVASLTDAVLYLVAYPFECSEQLASRVLAIAALRDVLTAFQAPGLPPADDLVVAVKRDIARLQALQDADGGFGFWRRGDPSWPYLSIHVAHALSRAQAKGFAVPKEMLDRSEGYLETIEKHIPPTYSPEAKRTLRAYALNVRQQMGKADSSRAQKLVAEAGIDGLSFEALGFLLPVLPDTAEAEAIRRHFVNRVSETAGAAHFGVSYSDGAQVLLHSNRRADAIVLEALIATDPGSDLIPKLVAGLQAHRTAGRWGNTQENAFVLLALDRYFATYEKATPDFVARAWLGDRLAAERPFRGRSTDRMSVKVPMRALGKDPVALTLAKEGPGRLYYRLGLRYAPSSLKLAAADRGFTVTRRYEAVDDPGDVSRAADGTWRVAAGARVRVRLSMLAPSRRYHVALVDWLPAGLEPMNPALATTGSLPATPASDVTEVGAPGLGSYWWWTRTWFEHQNMRDERVEAFASLLWEGVWEYSYIARATTPGIFVVPPTRAEEMYAPETFGRSASDRLVVE